MGTCQTGACASHCCPLRFASFDFEGPDCEILCNNKPAWFKDDVQGVASQVI